MKELNLQRFSTAA